MNHSNQHSLDRPIWAALTAGHSRFSQGDGLARRYQVEVAPFAAVMRETPVAYQALHQLLLPHEQVSLLSIDPVAPINALRAKPIGMIHQMVPTGSVAGAVDARDIVALTHADAQQMRDLVLETKPGPFGRRSHETGRYIGIRDQGRLIAMAGERMRFDGYVEISAVCVDERWRGGGACRSAGECFAQGNRVSRGNSDPARAR